MKLYYTHKYLFLLLFISGITYSREFRVNQIPNGSKFGCTTCHNSPFGGDARNPFGQLVETKFLNSQGNVIWNAELAITDSDGDGTTNGQELQDPNGTWKSGQADPGSSSLVTNPGNISSVPVGTDINDMKMPTTYSLSQNYPNPFNPSTTIKFSIPQSADVSLEVYDITGNIVAQLINSTMPAGEHSYEFNASNLASGIYFYRIRANEFLAARKFILVK